VPLPDPSQLAAAAQSLGAFIRQQPRVGLVLGSGLGSFADGLDDLERVPYERIAHFPTASVVGHAGNLCLGRVGAVPVACLQGRAHLYEGRAVDEVVFGVSLLARLGVSAVLLTNAAGGIAPTFAPGDLMLITDHLNLTGANPLQGPPVPGVPRFVDMSYAYDPELNELARRAARAVGVDLAEGVYAGLRGPNYETPAEIRMLRVLGADAVGMSTVLEVLALRGLNVRVAGVSCITNLAAGLSKTTLSHDEVGATAALTSQRFRALLNSWIQAIGESALS
jgi:purine-nucleoside phosphorylase